VLGAVRVVSAVDHTLEAVDRDEQAARLVDYQRRSSATLHVAQAAAELEQQLAALDRLPERRRAVEEEIARLGDKLDSLELRLREAPRAGQAPALLEELTDLRSQLTERVRLLEETNAAAPAAPPIPSGPHRTRRRGIHRAGSTYVVLVADENGVKHPKVATTLAEAPRATRDAEGRATPSRRSPRPSRTVLSLGRRFGAVATYQSLNPETLQSQGSG
jgi:hypothetical protein